MLSPGSTASLLTERAADLVVIGGGLGGQLTVHGVPPDESKWVESRPNSASYAEFRERVREHYRRHFPLTAEAAADPLLNPGAGGVSRLCREPRVGALVLEEMVSPLLSSGRLQWLREHEPVAVGRGPGQLSLPEEEGLAS